VAAHEYKIGLTIYCKLISKMQGEQDGLLELVILNFIFKWDNGVTY
jgi:hypothetical protein